MEIKQVSNMNKTLEIIKLYELEYYFKCLMLYNNGNNNSYHNFHHIITVVKNIYFIAKNTYIPDDKIRLMVIAGLFHDFNHTGGESKSDSDNINAAISTFSYYTKENQSDNDFIIHLINITEFPFTKNESLSIFEQIIRDADMMQCLEDNFIQQTILGLNNEFHISSSITIENVEREINFMNSIELFTDYAKEVMKSKLKSKREDCEYLLKILKEII